MTNLTERWKSGELEEGNYYIKDKYGNFIIAQYLPDYDYDHQDGHCFDGYSWYGLGFDYDDLEQDSVKEVLAPVPSYEEYSRLEWYAGCGPDIIVELNKENRQLRKWCEEFNALDVAKENQKLKELLKECRKEYTGEKEYTDTQIVDMIDEVLNVEKTNNKC